MIPQLRFVICYEKGQQYYMLGSIASIYKLFHKVAIVFFLEGEWMAVEGRAAVAHTGMELSLVGAKCIYSAHSFVMAPTEGFSEHEAGAFYTVCYCPLSLDPVAEGLEPQELKGHLSEKGLN